MNDSTVKLVGALFVAFPMPQVTPSTIEVYERFLDELEPSALDRAVKAAIRTCKFRPTVSEVLELARVTDQGARRTGAEAWGDVVKAIREVGAYRVPTFADEITAYAVERLGWRNLCVEGSSDAADRARFVEVYDAASGRRDRGEQIGIELTPRGDAEYLGRGRQMYGEHESQSGPTRLFGAS